MIKTDLISEITSLCGDINKAEQSTARRNYRIAGLSVLLLLACVACRPTPTNQDDHNRISEQLSQINAATPEEPTDDDLGGLLTPGPKRRGEQMREAMAKPLPPK